MTKPQFTEILCIHCKHLYLADEYYVCPKSGIKSYDIPLIKDCKYFNKEGVM